jgi:AcrR family transcriptional regulator
VNDSAKGVRKRVLETAKAIYTNSDLGSVTMDEVAKAAGVGRATLYRHFRNRDDLVLAVIETEAVAIAGRVERKIRSVDSPAQHIIEGMVQAMDEINKSKLFRTLFQSGGSSIVNRLLFDTDRLTNIGLEIMLPVVQRAQQSGELNTGMSLDMLVEWIMRMLISLITVPSKQLNSKRAVREMLHATMLPVLEGR